MKNYKGLKSPISSKAANPLGKGSNNLKKRHAANLKAAGVKPLKSPLK